MGGKKGKILFIEDDKVDRKAFERFAGNLDFPFDYIITGSLEGAENILRSEKFDAVVTDYRLGDGTAFDLFEKGIDYPIIIVTGMGNEGLAVKAMKAGACDYFNA